MRARAGSRGRACARALVWALPGGGVRGELGAGLSGARLGRAGREREGERGRAGRGARLVRAASGARGVLGSGPAQRGGWWRVRAVRSRGRGPGRCSAAFGKEGGEGRKERGEEKKEKEERKRKEKENGKKKKKKEGKEKGKREGERGPRRDHGADRGAGRPRLASGCARARRAGRGETGCWIRVSGLWGNGSPGGTGRIPENWVRVSRRDLELNDEAKFLAHDLF